MDCKTKISDFIDAKKDEMIATLKRLASVPSVLGDAEDNMPYGREIDSVLKLALSEIEALGLDGYCYENRADIASINDKEANLAILCHLDVVPASPEDWTNPPFEPTIRGDLIYGRGVSDNKGPAVAALYALYAIKELGIKLKNNVMLYLGGCEENRCADLNYYLERNTLPKYVFTPDACFPVGNAERGRIVVTCNTEYESDKIISVASGKGVNVIPDSATAILKNVEGFEPETVLNTYSDIKYTIEKEQDCIALTVFGKSTHAAHPSCGVNALTALLSAISEYDSGIKQLSEYFPHNVFDGKGLGLDGGLDISLTQLKIENGKMFFTADGRVNLSESAEALSQRIEDKIQYPIELLVKEPHYVDEKADIVQKLSKVYEEYTGLNGGTYTLDAMTYAHSVSDAVIFGGVIPGDGCDNAHAADERYDLNTLVKSAKIFAGAIMKICEVED